MRTKRDFITIAALDRRSFGWWGGCKNNRVFLTFERERLARNRIVGEWQIELIERVRKCIVLSGIGAQSLGNAKHAKLPVHPCSNEYCAAERGHQGLSENVRRIIFLFLLEILLRLYQSAQSLVRRKREPFVEFVRGFFERPRERFSDN